MNTYTYQTRAIRLYCICGSRRAHSASGCAPSVGTKIERHHSTRTPQAEHQRYADVCVGVCVCVSGEIDR